MNWVTIIAGVVLFVAPFLFGYTGAPAALWTGLVMGVVIAFLGYRKLYRWAAGAGVVTLIAPFVLGFSGIAAALWTCLIVGAVVALLDGYRGFLSEEAKTGGMQQHHA